MDPDYIMNMDTPVSIVQQEFLFNNTLPFQVNQVACGESLIQMHTHNAVEFGCAIQGSGWLDINGTEFTMSAEDLFFIDASIPHWHYACSGSPFTIIWILLPIEALVSLLYGKADLRLFEPFIALRSGISPVIQNKPELTRITRDILHLYRDKPPDWDMLALPKILKLLVEISMHVMPALCDKKLSIRHNIQTIQNGIYYINMHYRESFSISSLAEICHLSPSRFTHLFKEVIGMSPLQYRDQSRVNYSLERMFQTQDTLNTIALDCGYSSLSHFTDVFEKLMGMPPGQYRIQHT